MAFHRDRIYPFLVSRFGDPGPIRRIRARVIPLAQGLVLEVGAGAGANFVHYSSTRVSTILALEPNPEMIRRARRRQHGLALAVEYLDLPGEHIPLKDGSVDSVVSTFTLCTVEAVQDVIDEIRRVVKPGGRLIFIELGLSPDPSVRRWQERLDPVVHGLFAGLRLTRAVPDLITRGGFLLEQVERGYLSRFPKPLTYCSWGTAVASHQE